jgi:transcriptional regulator with XRE-family HTH domain
MTRLKFERTRRGLSQYSLGRVAKISQPDIGLIETGRLSPSAEQLARLAAVFGLPADVILRPVEIVERP